MGKGSGHLNSKCSRINEILHHYYSKFRKISSSSVDVVVRKEEEIEVNVHWLNVCMRMSERRSIATMSLIWYLGDVGHDGPDREDVAVRLPRLLRSALDLYYVVAGWPSPPPASSPSPPPPKPLKLSTSSNPRSAALVERAARSPLIQPHPDPRPALGRAAEGNQRFEGTGSRFEEGATTREGRCRQVVEQGGGGRGAQSGERMSTRRRAWALGDSRLPSLILQDDRRASHEPRRHLLPILQQGAVRAAPPVNRIAARDREPRRWNGTESEV